MNSFIIRFHRSSFAMHPLLITCAALLLTFVFLPSGIHRGLMQNKPGPFTSNEGDSGLQTAASLALGEREGTVIVMDAQSGRIRAMVNRRVATEQAFAPGSTIKPFATLSALQAGVLSKDSRLLCREKYRRADFEIRCSHPKEQPPFTPSQALAYSCNYYFGELGEQLGEETFGRTLASFGFGLRTGFSETEAEGQVPRGSRGASNVLGEGTSLQVTPLQLIAAYAALVNGGRLYVPQQMESSQLVPKERGRIEIDPSHRKVIIDGMRGAIEVGTAEKARLASLPLNVIGKTGTSTAFDSARTQGWFVGFTADDGFLKDAAPESIKLVVLVFLKRGHGVESAIASHVIFEEVARQQSQGEAAARYSAAAEQQIVPAGFVNIAMPVRVHLSRSNATRTMSLEDYILGVVASEGSVENELESLKALAVAARTYAMKNLNRHAGDDYDFCTLTHCQRYMAIAREDARASVVRAVDETAGEVLRDIDSRIVDSYFSASCGGMTADIHSLWGVAPRSYLRTSRDDNCVDAPNSSWTDIIPAANLTVALQQDRRSNVGPALRNIVVRKRDASGRAELIDLVGTRRRTLGGWDFKIIVGRALGWNVLKSSRFTISREGSNFVFRGSGFGHGLGLCQEGAHVMAGDGINYRQILERYFPGTSVRKEDFVRDRPVNET